MILLQVPVINPDGLDLIAHWYRENVGTPYETAPLPWLYQKYAGHDNNRDWFMLNLAETRAVTPAAVSRLVSADRLQPAPGAAIPGAHFRSALCRAAQSAHSGVR